MERAMLRFKRGRRYRVICMETPLEELELFFDEMEGANAGGNGATTSASGGFAVVTDRDRRFVLGVATRTDLDEFVKRRPALG